MTEAQEITMTLNPAALFPTLYEGAALPSAQVAQPVASPTSATAAETAAPVESGPEREARQAAALFPSLRPAEVPAETAKPAEAIEGDKPADPVAVAAYAAEVGLDMSHPDADLAGPLLHDLKLSRQQAERLLAVQDQIAQRQVAEWGQETRRTVSQSDIAAAQGVVRQFGDKATVAFLSAGAGNHPALVALLARVSRAMARR